MLIDGGGNGKTSSKDIAQLASLAADEKKALRVVTLDLRGISMIADYFVICSGRTSTQVQAVAENVLKRLEERGINFIHREGYRDGRWILLDYGTVVVHVFHEEDRIFYNLERLWGDAGTVDWKLP